jgi:hypothetical protein
MDKRKAQQLHFLNRMQFRAGTVSFVDMISFNQQIQEQKTVVVAKKTNRVTAHGIYYKDSWIIVLYDKHRKQVITLLPKVDKLYKDLEYILKESGQIGKIEEPVQVEEEKKPPKPIKNIYESDYEQWIKEQYPELPDNNSDISK